MSSSDPSKALLMQHFLKDLTIMLSEMAFHAAETQRAKPYQLWRVYTAGSYVNGRFTHGALDG
jgi:hypothetical protein